jgi:ADP-heptose:LPS heptosyltransferase
MKKLKTRNKPERFLVVSTTGIGDTLMSTPAIRALRESFPASQIDLLVHSKKKELLFKNPRVNRILGYRNNFFSRGLLVLKTFPYRYDHVLIFHANDDIWKILKMVRYGECHIRQKYKNLPRKAIPLESLPQHSIQRRLALVEKIGGKNSQDYRYEYFLPESQIRWAKQQLAGWGISAQDKLVGMQVGAADAYKCWPLESFVEVGRYLQAKHGAKIYLNASMEEKDLAGQFLKLLGEMGVFHLPGISLSQSAALIKACSLFISNDTGPMHMAIGLGVPLVALFCPTDSEITGPIAYPRAIAIQKSVPCNPCKVRDCRDNFCMRQISVGEVCLAADRLLNHDRATRGGVRP